MRFSGEKLTNEGSPRVFDAAEVSEIIDICEGSEVRDQLHDSVSDAINGVLRKVFFELPILYFKKGELRKGDMPNVIMRRETLHSVFDFVRKHQQGPSTNCYERALERLGADTGYGFGYDLIELLRRHQSVPEDYEALLGFWSAYDQSSGWGKITFQSFQRDRIEIRVDQSFLISGHDKDIHRDCPFLAGYIKGVVSSAFSEYSRWLDRTRIRRPPEHRLKPSGIDEYATTDSTCVFRGRLYEETLVDSFNKLGESQDAFRKGDLLGTLKSACSAMEFALKDKFSIGASFSFSEVLSICRKIGVPLSEESYEVAKTYDFATSMIGGRYKFSKEETSAALKEVVHFVNEIEQIAISNEQKNHVRVLLEMAT
jgi:hypothetical protein